MISPVELKDKVVALHQLQDKKLGLSLFQMPSSYQELPREPKATQPLQNNQLSILNPELTELGFGRVSSP